jgi:hypothetical protein
MSVDANRAAVGSYAMKSRGASPELTKTEALALCNVIAKWKYASAPGYRIEVLNNPDSANVIGPLPPPTQLLASATQPEPCHG